MKYYKSVIDKAEEINYKKGINRIDTKSGFYSTAKVLYYIAFAWFTFFQASYLFANTMALLFFEKAGENVDTPLFVTSVIVFVLTVAALVFIKLKWHIAALVLNIGAPLAQIIALNRNEFVSLAFLEGGFLNNKYFWFHYAPAGLIMLFTLVVCIIGIKSYVYFKNDYKNAMSAMYTEYSETHAGISDIEWQQHLEELDAQRVLEKGKK